MNQKTESQINEVEDPEVKHYEPKPEGEKKFWKQHIIKKHADRNGNGDSAFVSNLPKDTTTRRADIDPISKKEVKISSPSTEKIINSVKNKVGAFKEQYGADWKAAINGSLFEADNPGLGSPATSDSPTAGDQSMGGKIDNSGANQNAQPQPQKQVGASKDILEKLAIQAADLHDRLGDGEDLDQDAMSRLSEAKDALDEVYEAFTQGGDTNAPKKVVGEEFVDEGRGYTSFKPKWRGTYGGRDRDGNSQVKMYWLPPQPTPKYDDADKEKATKEEVELDEGKMDKMSLSGLWHNHAHHAYQADQGYGHGVGSSKLNDHAATAIENHVRKHYGNNVANDMVDHSEHHLSHAEYAGPGESKYHEDAAAKLRAKHKIKGDLYGMNESANVLDEATVKDATGTIVGTHHAGEGFKPNALGKKLGHKPHPTDVPKNTTITKRGRKVGSKSFGASKRSGETAGEAGAESEKPSFTDQLLKATDTHEGGHVTFDNGKTHHITRVHARAGLYHLGKPEKPAEKDKMRKHMGASKENFDSVRKSGGKIPEAPAKYDPDTKIKAKTAAITGGAKTGPVSNPRPHIAMARKIIAARKAGK